MLKIFAQAATKIRAGPLISFFKWPSGKSSPYSVQSDVAESRVVVNVASKFPSADVAVSKVVVNVASKFQSAASLRSRFYYSSPLSQLLSRFYSSPRSQLSSRFYSSPLSQPRSRFYSSPLSQLRTRLYSSSSLSQLVQLFSPRRVLRHDRHDFFFALTWAKGFDVVKTRINNWTLSYDLFFIHGLFPEPHSRVKLQGDFN